MKSSAVSEEDGLARFGFDQRGDEHHSRAGANSISSLHRIGRLFFAGWVGRRASVLALRLGG
jgi:hypothetical protein